MGVRCLVELASGHYEERITLWQVSSSDAAIELAESDIREYAVNISATYLGLAQAYELPDPPSHGAEAFSLIRNSDLPLHECRFSRTRDHLRVGFLRN
jgi:hypothetical protein